MEGVGRCLDPTRVPMALTNTKGVRLIEAMGGSPTPISRNAVGRRSTPLGGVVVAVLLAYILVPVASVAAARAILALATIGVVAVLWAFVRQVRQVYSAERPTLAAVHAIAVVFGILITLFAFIYLSLGQSDPQAFDEPLDKVAGIHFSVTVLATVGFGDIVAVSSLAKVLVSSTWCSL